MDENAKKARRAYASAWRAANKDKVREYNQRYWKRKAEQMLFPRIRKSDPCFFLFKYPLFLQQFFF